MLKYNKKLEIINTITGLILILISVIYWQQQNIESAANWFIFGAMYLVMDFYKTNAVKDNLTKLFIIIRIVFSVAGNIAAFLFLLYTLS
jgi:hypothetical protein